MSSVYGAIEQSRKFEAIAQEISGKRLDLEKQLLSNRQPFVDGVAEEYFDAIYSVLKDSISKLSSTLSSSGAVVTSILDKKNSEIESLHQRLDSLIASTQFAKGDATSHTVYDQFIPVPYRNCTPHCEPVDNASFVPFSEVDLTACPSTSVFSQQRA